MSVSELQQMHSFKRFMAAIEERFNKKAKEYDCAKDEAAFRKVQGAREDLQWVLDLPDQMIADEEAEEED